MQLNKILGHIAINAHFSALIMFIFVLIYGGMMVWLFMITINLKEKYG